MKQIKVLVVGKRSFLSNSYKKNTKIKNVKFISLCEIKKVNFDEYSHIINFSIDPNNYIKQYNLTNKIDKYICNLIKKKKCIYIFPSSRLVYSKSKNNFYGTNKKKTEKDIIKIKKEYLILRIGTILTFDLSKKNLFISQALNSLKKKGFVELDISKSTYKDFLPSYVFVKILDDLIKKSITGKYNISSNIPINVGDILQNIIRGYGRGKIIYKKISKKNHSFLLNNSSLKKKIRFYLTKKDILRYCFNLGKKLNA